MQGTFKEALIDRCEKEALTMKRANAHIDDVTLGLIGQNVFKSLLKQSGFLEYAAFKDISRNYPDYGDFHFAKKNTNLEIKTTMMGNQYLIVPVSQYERHKGHVSAYISVQADPEEMTWCIDGYIDYEEVAEYDIEEWGEKDCYTIPVSDLSDIKSLMSTFK